MLAAMLASGCASHPDFPPGIVGYHCSRFEITPAGTVSASAIPDYRGGYRMFMMKWETPRGGAGSLEANALWTHGREAIAPPGWLSVSGVAVDLLPPMDTRMRLQLSTGEIHEQKFREPKDWEGSKKWEGRFTFGGYVHVRDQVFIDKFTQADWADLSVIDPAGVVLTRKRLNLAGVADAVARMYRLGGQVIADIGDYRHRCQEVPYVDISEIVLRMRPAADPVTPGSTRTST